MLGLIPILIIATGNNGMILIGNSNGVIGINGTIPNGSHQIITVGGVGITLNGTHLIVMTVIHNGIIMHGTVQIAKIILHQVITQILRTLQIRQTVLLALHAIKIGLCGTIQTGKLKDGITSKVGITQLGNMKVIIIGNNGIIPIGNHLGQIGQNGI